MLYNSVRCFSFESDTNLFNIRDKSDAKLIDFYSMNYPAFIDVFLYQLGGFYNRASDSSPNSRNAVYYSENQLSRVATHSAENVINFLNVENIQKLMKRDALQKPDDPKETENIKIKSELIRHTILRMFLIPSDELKKISSIEAINTKTPHSSDKGIDYDIISAKNHVKLAQDFCQNFYLKKVIPKLEKRLKELLGEAQINSVDPNYTPVAQEEIGSKILNRGLLYKLVETNIDNGTGIKNLKNLSDANLAPALISNLFEFILIMLKLKFIEKQIYDIDTAVLQMEKPIVESEKSAIQSEIYKTLAKKIFTLWRNGGGKNNSDILDKLKTAGFIDNIITDNELKPEKFIPEPSKSVKSTILELKQVEAYVAYKLIEQLFKCIKYDATTPDKFKTYPNPYITNINQYLGTISDNKILGEKIKQDILELQRNFLMINAGNCKGFVATAPPVVGPRSPVPIPPDPDATRLAKLTQLKNEYESIKNNLPEILNLSTDNDKKLAYNSNITDIQKHIKTCELYINYLDFLALKQQFEALLILYQNALNALPRGPVPPQPPPFLVSFLILSNNAL